MLVGCRGAIAAWAGAEEVQRHGWFSDIDWAALEAGEMEAPFVPMLSSIHAESQEDIGVFDAIPKAIALNPKDHAAYAASGWAYTGTRAFAEEMIWFLEKEGAQAAASGGREHTEVCRCTVS